MKQTKGGGVKKSRGKTKRRNKELRAKPVEKVTGELRSEIGGEVENLRTVGSEKEPPGG